MIHKIKIERFSELPTLSFFAFYLKHGYILYLNDIVILFNWGFKEQLSLKGCFFFKNSFKA